MDDSRHNPAPVHDPGPRALRRDRRRRRRLLRRVPHLLRGRARRAAARPRPSHHARSRSAASLLPVRRGAPQVPAAGAPRRPARRHDSWVGSAGPGLVRLRLRGHARRAAARDRLDAAGGLRARDAVGPYPCRHWLRVLFDAIPAHGRHTAHELPDQPGGRPAAGLRDAPARRHRGAPLLPSPRPRDRASRARTAAGRSATSA